MKGENIEWKQSQLHTVTDRRFTDFNDYTLFILDHFPSAIAYNSLAERPFPKNQTNRKHCIPPEEEQRFDKKIKPLFYPQ